MHDNHRPVYHFLPERNWMNDPNGLIQYEGVYHMFYQHNPQGPLWGNMSWGHARSIDLVHWEHLPIALQPDADGADSDGCYSGVMVVHDGIPTIVYTGVRGADQLCCLAMPVDDELMTWQKYPHNPVIHSTPAGVPATIFRDHTLWRDGDSWLMGVGAGVEAQGGAVLLYRSSDLREWEYLHPLAIEQAELNDGQELISTGWECPDFFFIDSEPVLLACEWDFDPISSAWWRGHMRNDRFHATSKRFTDHGDALYAPQTFQSENGRRLLIGWLRELRSDEDQMEAGWSGVMSLPREVRLTGSDSIAFQPAAEVRNLRGDQKDIRVRQGTVLTSAACELSVTSMNGFSLSWANGLAIVWSGEELRVKTDTRSHVVAVPAEGREALEINVFIDHSVVEVFVNCQTVVSTRVYADVSSWSEMRVASADSVEVSVTVWDINPIW